MEQNRSRKKRGICVKEKMGEKEGRKVMCGAMKRREKRGLCVVEKEGWEREGYVRRKREEEQGRREGKERRDKGITRRARVITIILGENYKLTLVTSKQGRLMILPSSSS